MVRLEAPFDELPMAVRAVLYSCDRTRLEGFHDVFVVVAPQLAVEIVAWEFDGQSFSAGMAAPLEARVGAVRCSDPATWARWIAAMATAQVVEEANGLENFGSGDLFESDATYAMLDHCPESTVAMLDRLGARALIEGCEPARVYSAFEALVKGGVGETTSVERFSDIAIEMIRPTT